MIDKVKDLEKIINYSFKSNHLLLNSLTHKSFDNVKNNEKLEFLGDRVLGLVLAKTLLKIYPGEKEGVIDKKFANLVNKKTCLLIAKKINISARAYFGYTKDPKTTHVKLAQKLENFLNKES